MDAIERRARELLAAECPECGGENGHETEDGWLLCGRCTDPHTVTRYQAMQAIIAALTPPEGHVVVTRNEAGQAVAVTRQDDEGRILSVIAEFGPPEGYALVPAIPSYEITKALAGTAGCNLAQAALAYRDALAACPEVP